jgi:eukaryotic-like serine/threonine-protein kinase
MRARPPRLPGYVLGVRLGGGSTCDVYSAVDLRGRASLAVKVLREDAARDPTNVQLLVREAQVGMSIRHKHLVRVVRAGVDESQPMHLVMERAPGRSLRRVLNAKGWLNAHVTCTIGRQVAGALAALHAAGFVHGDVKPDNIHVCAGPTATLLDLGFAHQPDDDHGLLCDGYILGTANYVAPELCEQPERDTPAADIFSLGVTLFEVLTGHLPYPQGNVGETMLQHRDAVPESLWRWQGGWPLGVADMVDRMLARNPDARPTAKTVERELGCFYATKCA